MDHHSISPTRSRRSSSTDKGTGLAASPGKPSPASPPTKGQSQGQGQGQGQHQDKSQGGAGTGAGAGANKGSKSVRMSAAPPPSNGTPKGQAGKKGITPYQSSVTLESLLHISLTPFLPPHSPISPLPLSLAIPLLLLSPTSFSCQRSHHSGCSLDKFFSNRGGWARGEVPHHSDFKDHGYRGQEEKTSTSQEIKTTRH